MSGGHEDGCPAAVDTSLAHATHIRELNDQARAAMSFRHVYVTVGIRALGEMVATAAILAVRAYQAFDPGNDPYHEHDFGAFDLAGQRAFWKIDYYDRQLECGSPNPADPAVTARVLTIMLAEEY
jgi:hypothetical protein